jgi:predicted HAD superfamily Cof-like phosphohydrolase
MTQTTEIVIGAKNPQELVRDFHLMYKVPILTEPNLHIEDIDMRVGLLDEEFNNEFIRKGLEKNDPFELADGIADLIWVTYSLAFATGVPARVIDLPRIVDLPQITPTTKAEAITVISRVKRTIEALQNIAESHKEEVGYFQKAIDQILTDAVELAVIFRVDLKYVLHEVALSNASKLAEDGSVIYFQEGPKKGKVAKGPNFFNPKLATAFSNAVNPEMP